MTNEIIKPAPLDPYKLHTPEEVDAWKAATRAYFDTIREEENRERMKEEAAKANANRTLNRQEYYEIAVQREAERQAQAAKREAERQAEQDAKDAYLASMPDVAEISAHSEYTFLLNLQHWFSKGYTISDDSIHAWMLGYYNVRLCRPTMPSKAKK